MLLENFYKIIHIKEREDGKQEIEVAICDRCGECFSWHGETNGIRKVKIKERV